MLFRKVSSFLLLPLFPFVYRYLEEEKMKRSIVFLCLLNLLVKILKSDSIDARNDVSQYLAKESDSIRNGIANTALPRGTILMIGSSEIDNWFNLLGVGLGEYRGWFLCDGRNGTPDLRGRFVVGRDVMNSQSNYVNMGSKGGNEFITLTKNQMPTHSHGVNLNTNSNGAHSHSYVDTLFPMHNGPVYYPLYPHCASASFSSCGVKWFNRNENTTDSGAHTHNVNGQTNDSGSSQPIDNRPPYYVVAYIIFKGL
jgi:microcystin-dependent protein